MNVQKPGDLTDEQKVGLGEELRRGCLRIGVNTVFSPPGKQVSIYSKVSFGLCADCGHFAFTATQYKIKLAVCEKFELTFIPLSETEPVVECSKYYKGGERDAHDFSKSAWLLDPPENEMGF